MDLSGPLQAILVALYFAGLQDTGFNLTHLELIFFCAGHGGTGGSALSILQWSSRATSCCWRDFLQSSMPDENLQQQEYWFPCSPENISIHGCQVKELVAVAIRNHSGRMCTMFPPPGLEQKLYLEQQKILRKTGI
jgi:hypothetical protein